jgi:hypothetical protein
VQKREGPIVLTQTLCHGCGHLQMRWTPGPRAHLNYAAKCLKENKTICEKAADWVPTPDWCPFREKGDA